MPKKKKHHEIKFREIIGQHKIAIAHNEIKNRTNVGKTVSIIHYILNQSHKAGHILSMMLQKSEDLIKFKGHQILFTKTTFEGVRVVSTCNSFTPIKK